MMLALTVLTSDDVHFSAMLTRPLTDEQDKPLSDAYAAARQKLGAEPNFMLTFVPLIQTVPGDVLTKKLNTISGGVPNFGTVALSHYADYKDTQVLYGGKGYADCLAAILFSGGIHAKYYVTSLSDKMIQKQKAVITESDANILKSVNGISALEFLRLYGFLNEYGSEGVHIVPFIIDYNDGTKPVARAIYSFTEEGYAVCGGEMPVNATLSVGTLDHDDIVWTAEKAIDAVLEKNENGVVLMFSCIARYLGLGADDEKEMARIAGKIGKVKHHLAYSAGEICPMYDQSGNTVNRYHNDTLVICVLS
jgi:hypothetical protein